MLPLDLSKILHDFIQDKFPHYCDEDELRKTR